MAVRQGLAGRRRFGRRGRVVPYEEEEGEGDGEVGEELRVRGGHAVAFAVHFCTNPIRASASCQCQGQTPRKRDWCRFKAI